MVKIRDMSRIAAKVIYNMYRNNPRGFFNFKSLYDELLQKIDDLNENDFIVLMKYLEDKRYIKAEKFLGSEMSWLFKPTAYLIDFIEE